MFKGVLLQYGLSGARAGAPAKFPIAEKHGEQIAQLGFTAWLNQKPIFPVINNFADALAVAADRRFGRCHRLQIHAAQPFIVAGQGKHSAMPHRFRSPDSALPSAKDHLFSDPEFAGKTYKALAPRSISNNFECATRNNFPYAREGPDQQSVSF